MKRILISGLVAGVAMLVVSILMVILGIKVLPGVFEEYYDETFNHNGNRDFFFYLHPFVLSFALAWFWQRFKSQFTGNFLIRALELGGVFTLVAVLPIMWITYSAISVSFALVGTWMLYGLVQACIAGLVFSKLNP